MMTMSLLENLQQRQKSRSHQSTNRGHRQPSTDEDFDRDQHPKLVVMLVASILSVITCLSGNGGPPSHFLNHEW